MKQLTIDVSQKAVDELQRADLELQARRAVIDRFLDRHMSDEDSSCIDSKPFNHFMSKLAESEAEFELAKQAITETYVPDYLEGHQTEWNLDYATKVLTINILCDCDIPELDKE